MSGRVEVHRLETRLNAAFSRAKATPDLETQGDLAKHLCVLVSGYVEVSVRALMLEHTRARSGTSVQRYVDSHLKRFANPKSQKLLSLLGSFDVEWLRDMEGFLVDEKKDALDSVVALRNQIAHGETPGVSLARIEAYFTQAKAVIARVEGLSCPTT